MQENIYNQYFKIQKDFQKGDLSFNDYSSSIIEWNDKFGDIIKSNPMGTQDLSHGGKLHKKIITDKTGKKVTKWVSDDQLSPEERKQKQQGIDSNGQQFSQIDAEKKYTTEEWEKSVGKASDESLKNASQFAGSSEIRRIARDEILKRELVPQAFMDFSLMPDFLLDSFVERYNNIPVTDKENKSLANYRDNDYIQINKKLRNEDKLDKKEADTINNISKVIDSSVLSNDIVLWRGLSGSQSLLFINFLKSLKPGEIYEEKSFTSTSMLQGQAIKFRDLYKDQNNLVIKILAPKGSKALSMQNLGGEDEKIMYKDEYEFLLNSNSKFQVIENKNGEMTVKLI